MVRFFKKIIGNSGLRYLFELKPDKYGFIIFSDVDKFLHLQPLIFWFLIIVIQFAAFISCAGTFYYFPKEFFQDMIVYWIYGVLWVVSLLPTILLFIVEKDIIRVIGLRLKNRF